MHLSLSSSTGIAGFSCLGDLLLSVINASSQSTLSYIISAQDLKWHLKLYHGIF